MTLFDFYEHSKIVVILYQLLRKHDNMHFFKEHSILHTTGLILGDFG
jgi:hypothetical protein